MKKFPPVSLTAAAVTLLTPLIALAAGINDTYIKGYSDSVVKIINGVLVPLLMAVAFIVFLWGVYKYFIYGAADETSRAEGRQFTIWGIVGFVIILSLWGIVNLLMSTLSLTGGTTPPYPTIGNQTGQVQVNGTNPSGGTTNNTVGGSGSVSTGDPICLAYGPGTGCTTTSGKGGTCDATNICIAN